jgi:hypothetical protein
MVCIIELKCQIYQIKLLTTYFYTYATITKTITTAVTINSNSILSSLGVGVVGLVVSIDNSCPV